MKEEIKNLIEKIGEEEAITILENSYNALTEEYMTFGMLRDEVEKLGDNQTVNTTIYMKFKKAGLVPGHDKLYGRKHIYNYLIANYIVGLVGIEQAVLIKLKLVPDQDNTIEVMSMYQELMRKDIKNKDNTLRGLAMIDKGRKLL